MRPITYYEALQKAKHGTSPDSMPQDLSADRLRERHYWHGANAHLLHPKDIERIFAGITLPVYQAIDHLYCSRVGRTIGMIWQILSAMASETAVPEVSYEAVWAICLHLHRRQQAGTEVTIQQTQTTWRIAQIKPAVKIWDREDSVYEPTITCVLDASSPKVVAFTVVRPEESEASIPLTLYDAIVSQRCPDREGAAGLTWQIPARVVAEMRLPEDSRRACRLMGIELGLPHDGDSPLLSTLRGDWDRDLAGRVLERDRFALLFDNYLEKFHWHGPLLSEQCMAWKHTGLLGYNRDPGWQFPALRGFLPTHTSTIAADGSVEYDGLHYENNLLKYWLNHQVVLRQSEVFQAVAWIYLNGEVLCQAVARESGWRDGSYYPN
jgi:hypothetical protein